jgi:hypothetical protein
MSHLDIQWRALGQHYGYPACCIEEFLKDCCQVTKDRFPGAPWLGTGYIPCPCCAEKAISDFDDFVTAVIAPARCANAVFPEEGPEEDIDAAIEAAWYASAEVQQPAPTPFSLRRIPQWMFGLVRL